VTDHQPYSIALDNRFGYLNLIDVPALVEATTETWFNQTLTQVDGSVVRLGIVQGEFHWHHHDDEDELFFVLDGELEIDLEGQDTVVLRRHQGFNVPRGTEHRTRARSKTVMLMMSAAGVAPTGS
jgi:mannose-6-phosphate isomerase-like protein (cupin superfamily)